MTNSSSTYSYTASSSSKSSKGKGKEKSSSSKGSSSGKSKSSSSYYKTSDPFAALSSRSGLDRFMHEPAYEAAWNPVGAASSKK
ncbi:hypothetical protein C8A05DRAFT_31693 [Staphylotrichum tortipilum]|uniref:Uncharacterized protein n=1 Tax=Staphylotrichum tortipilum TaxID=2831512 RepID=A0AAN6MQE4_9PEZI|nr:hypothetical protein C8A05DRAFT_31693 [Staphylotrichum longicolle]